MPVLVARGPRVKGVVHWGASAAILNSLTGVLSYEGPGTRARVWVARVHGKGTASRK